MPQLCDDTLLVPFAEAKLAIRSYASFPGNNFKQYLSNILVIDTMNLLASI